MILVIRLEHDTRIPSEIARKLNLGDGLGRKVKVFGCVAEIDWVGTAAGRRAAILVGWVTCDPPCLTIRSCINLWQTFIKHRSTSATVWLSAVGFLCC